MQYINSNDFVISEKTGKVYTFEQLNDFGMTYNSYTDISIGMRQSCLLHNISVEDFDFCLKQYNKMING